MREKYLRVGRCLMGEEDNKAWAFFIEDCADG